MSSPLKYPILSSDLQVGFHFKLKAIKDLYFHEALSKTIRSLAIASIDAELSRYVSADALQKLASLSLRGETIFPIPIVLSTNPFLLGYYRLLLGFSQKEFYNKGPFGSFKAMEDRGIITAKAAPNLSSLCLSLIASSESLISQIGDFELATVAELQLLTVGPQLRGSANVSLGQVATQKTFAIIKELVKGYIVNSDQNSIHIRNNSGRTVSIQFSPDPDIEIIEELSTGPRGLVSIEIKGGRDVSNIHNRIGEAEKSHQKARQRGYNEFMTIISVEVDYNILRRESPTTTHFFHLDKIDDKTSNESEQFKQTLASILGIVI